MAEIKFYKSKWKAVRLILLSLPFVIAGIFLLLKHDDNRGMWWFCICFFGMGIPLGLFNLLDTRPELVLDENGIFDRMSYGIFDKRPSKEGVQWDWIKAANVKVIQNSFRGMPITPQKYICIDLDEEGILHKQVKRNKLVSTFAMGDFNIPLMNLNIDEQKLLDLINAMKTATTAMRNNLLQTTQL